VIQAETHVGLQVTANITKRWNVATNVSKMRACYSVAGWSRKVEDSIPNEVICQFTYYFHQHSAPDVDQPPTESQFSRPEPLLYFQVALHLSSQGMNGPHSRPTATQKIL
jgi:hypothetical protein